jgi:serine/threonine protein phosphatase PrpC
MLGEIPLSGLSRERNSAEKIPAAITDVGCEREINEDRYAVIDSPAGRAWLVCDGMGGALGGELAAQLAIDAIRRALESNGTEESDEALRSSLEEANRIIVLRRQNPAFSAMGTTIVAALINGSELIISHAGDSRAYIVRGTETQQLTTDHTYVQELVERGAISQEEAMNHPQSHVLTKCLGADPRIEIETQPFWIWDTQAGEEQDILLLCSDGLYSLVADDEIAEIVNTNPPQDACVQLTELAKLRGGYDNITLAIVPLGGVLRDECPTGQRALKKKKVAKKQSGPQRQKRTLTAMQKVLVVMMLAVLGVLCAALFVVFGMGA